MERKCINCIHAIDDPQDGCLGFIYCEVNSNIHGNKLEVSDSMDGCDKFSPSGEVANIHTCKDCKFLCPGYSVSSPGYDIAGVFPAKCVKLSMECSEDFGCVKFERK